MGPNVVRYLGKPLWAGAGCRLAAALASPYARDKQAIWGFGPGGTRGLNAVLGRDASVAPGSVQNSYLTISRGQTRDQKHTW